MENGPITYRGPCGTDFIGYVAVPDRPSGAGVLIAHNAPGLGEHERTVADKLAALGYVALAADYHGGGAVLQGEALGARMGMFTADPTRLRAVIAAAHACLLTQPYVETRRTATIGYCFGGYAVLEFARSGADVAAVVGFHALLPSGGADEARNVRGKVLVCQATMDPYVPEASRATFEKAMDEAGVDWQMTLYGGTQHAFTIPHADRFDMPGIAYHARNAQRSWDAMIGLFAETIDRT